MDTTPPSSSPRVTSLEVAVVETSQKRQWTAYCLIYVVWLVVLGAGTGAFADFHAWLNSWAKWDAQWYERIWNEGYPRADPRTLVFPPGYSLLVGGVTTFLHLDFHLTAMVLNITSYFAALLLAVDLFAKALKVSPIWVFSVALSSPAGYFIFAAYSDAVFSLVLWATLYLALLYPRRRIARVGEISLLLLAPWIRLGGYALISWILLKRWTALAVCVSLVGWLVLNAMIGGQAFYFLHAQELFRMPEGNFMDGLRSTFSGLRPAYVPGRPWDWTAYLQFHLLPACYFVGLLLTAIWLCYRRQPLIGITVLSILFMSHNQSFWRSAVRYDLPISCCLGLPILAFLRNKRPLKPIVSAGLWGTVIVVSAAQFMLQIYFANLFKSGRWAF